MMTANQIEELGQWIGRVFHADRVVLFGSYARGVPVDDSDEDLLVVAETSLPPRERYPAVRHLVADYPAPFDIIVKTPRNTRAAGPLSIMSSILPRKRGELSMSDETGEAVRQWRAKAQSDWTAVEILLGSEQCPADTVCFHCQQFIEKLLKALLALHDIEAPRTHDLRRLIQLAEPFVPELARFS